MAKDRVEAPARAGEPLQPLAEAGLVEASIAARVAARDLWDHGSAARGRASRGRAALPRPVDGQAVGVADGALVHVRIW